jgi:carbon-monoxide dehydrogenase large subunit
MKRPWKGRREDHRLLTGQGRYTADHYFPNQLYACFLRSDRAHAEIVTIDSEAAQAVPGVVRILTGQDIAREQLATPPVLAPFKGKDGTSLISPYRPMLAVDRKRSPVTLLMRA